MCDSIKDGTEYCSGSISQHAAVVLSYFLLFHTHTGEKLQVHLQNRGIIEEKGKKQKAGWRKWGRERDRETASAALTLY